jgi:radical SAM superfamily enzyme YgiQ (UPF0313 family)
MHVCLVTAPTATEYRSADEWNSDEVLFSAARPQLGVLNLAAVLEGAGDRPDIVNVNRAYLEFVRTVGSTAGNCDFAGYLATRIAENDANVYGFSSICSTYPLTVRVAESLKKLRPDATILFGGPQATVVDVSTLAAFPFVDLVLRGEAEASLPLLLEELSAGMRFDQVPGLTYRDGLQIKRNANAPVIADLDALPSPAYHITNWLEGASIAYLELGRGCPFSCTFCSTNDFFRRNFRLRSPERILGEMRAVAKKYSITHFDLVHDMFTVDKRRVAAFCEVMAGSGDGFTWSCSARTDCVDEALLELMAQSGCRGVFFGVEAGSRRMQSIIDKHLDPQRAEEIIDITERVGISSIVSLITGFPQETWDDVRETLRMFMHSVRCPHSGPQLNILAPLAATPIYTLYKSQLVLEELCSDMSHQGLSQNEADLELIRNNLEIFPNFYLLPMPHLDRDALLELREFLTMAVECYRWLLSAIDQSVTNILDFYLEWREHRNSLRPDLIGNHLRRYYVGPDFRSDFLNFLGQHPVGQEHSVASLLAAEEALVTSTFTMAQSGQPITPGEPLFWTDVPSNAKFINVIDLQFDLQQITEALKSRTGLPPQEICFYAVHEAPDGTRGLTKVSALLAALIRACDGTRTIEEVVTQLSVEMPEVKEEEKRYVFINLLQQAQSQGVVAISRASRMEISVNPESFDEALEMPSAT